MNIIFIIQTGTLVRGKGVIISNYTGVTGNIIVHTTPAYIFDHLLLKMNYVDIFSLQCTPMFG